MRYNAIKLTLGAGVAKLESMVKSKGAVQKSTGGWGVQSVPGLPQEERISYALQKLILVDMFGQEDSAIKREVVHLFERLIISKNVFFPDDKRWVTFSEVIQKGNKLAVTAIGIDTSVKENLAVVSPDGGFDAQ